MAWQCARLLSSVEHVDPEVVQALRTHMAPSARGGMRGMKSLAAFAAPLEWEATTARGLTFIVVRARRGPM